MGKDGLEVGRKSVTYYTCDRCRKTRERDIGFKSVTLYERSFFNIVVTNIDLCQDCYEDFKRFMDGAKAVEDGDQ